MSRDHFNKGPSYWLSAEVKNRLLSKYDPQKEAELRSWIEGLTSLSISPNFQKGLKDRIILHTLMNKLQPGSVPMINRSMQNWHQRGNLSNFIKAIVSYGMNPMNLFEANNLFESGNMTQVLSLLALVGKMGTNKCASQLGMTMYSTGRHLYSPKNHILLQMGTNKCASQVGMTAPWTQQQIYDTKLGTNKCDNSSMSLQMGYTQGANQRGQVFGLGRQIYNSKYCPQGSVADRAPSGPEEAPEYPPYYQEEASY
uniref:Calponin n=1 Tax=Macaca nemestrina TaxID=9545 RepID=A0A2K6B265_MACNE